MDANMDTNIEARIGALAAELDQAKADLQQQMVDLAAEADVDLDTYLNPPVQVVCDFDGAVTQVVIDPKRSASMTGQELRQAINAAGQHPRYAAPPLVEGGSPEQRMQAMADQARTALVQFDALTGSVETPASVQEVTGMNTDRTVTVTYRGRFLNGIDCQEVWLATANPDQIQDAVTEASQAALRTIRTLDKRR